MALGGQLLAHIPQEIHISWLNTGLGLKLFKTHFSKNFGTLPPIKFILVEAGSLNGSISISSIFVPTTSMSSIFPLNNSLSLALFIVGIDNGSMPTIYGSYCI